MALVGLTAVANAQSGMNGKWCLNEYRVGEEVNCSFVSLSQCNQSKIGPRDTCTRNRRTTTGFGSATKNKDDDTQLALSEELESKIASRKISTALIHSDDAIMNVSQWVLLPVGVLSEQTDRGSARQAMARKQR